MDTLLQQSIRDAGWIFPMSIWETLSEYEKTFLRLEFTGQRTFTYYVHRLNALGFKNMPIVLDAACGMGQWSVALSETNPLVIGIDVDSRRVDIASTLAQSMGRAGCIFQIGSMETLPYRNRTMDGIFCYGALMFTNIPKTLAEFYRILKPHGRLYVNANSYGWYAHMLIDRGIKQRNRAWIRAALRMILRTLAGKTSQVVVGKRWLVEQMEQVGLEVMALDVEGHICLEQGNAKPDPAYPSRFYGMDAILEVMAVK